MEIEYQIYIVKDKWGNTDCIMTDDYTANGQISLMSESMDPLNFDDNVNHLKGWAVENDLEYKMLNRTESIDIDWNNL